MRVDARDETVRTLRIRNEKSACVYQCAVDELHWGFGTN